LTITRPTNDIAFVIAGGSGGDATLLDRLTFNSPSTAVTGDVYELSMLAGQTATVSTDTPFDKGALLPPNALDPSLRIIDPNGQLVLADSDSRDGKNAQLQFTATVAGIYLVQIESQTGAGAYVLNVSKSLPSGDFDSDLAMDGIDFLVWQRGFNVSPATIVEGDATGDGAVDGQDLQHWQEGFGALSFVASHAVAMMATESNSPQVEEQISSHSMAPSLVGLTLSGLPALTTDLNGRVSIRNPSHIDPDLSTHHSQQTAESHRLQARTFAARDEALSALALESTDVGGAPSLQLYLDSEAKEDVDTLGVDELFGRNALERAY
jgi:hypothetical protein